MEYDEKLDKKIIKEIERNELIKLIYENCNNKNMNLIICKKIKGFEFLEEIEEDYITDNFEFFYKNNLQRLSFNIHIIQVIIMKYQILSLQHIMAKKIFI